MKKSADTSKLAKMLVQITFVAVVGSRHFSKSKNFIVKS